MDTKVSANMEILAMFSTFKEKRIRLYDSFIKDIDDFDDWAIAAERLLAYYITARNLKNYGKIIKEQLQKELLRLNEGDFDVQ